MGDLSRRYGVSKAAISIRAKKEGWTQDISEAVNRMSHVPSKCNSLSALEQFYFKIVFILNLRCVQFYSVKPGGSASGGSSTSGRSLPTWILAGCMVSPVCVAVCLNVGDLRRNAPDGRITMEGSGVGQKRSQYPQPKQHEGSTTGPTTSKPGALVMLMEP